MTSIIEGSAQDLGVTGSLLTSTHNPAFSDIDLLVYGQARAAHLKHSLGSEGAARFRRPSAERLQRWSEQVAQRHPLSVEKAAHLDRR